MFTYGLFRRLLVIPKVIEQIFSTRSKRELTKEAASTKEKKERKRKLIGEDEEPEDDEDIPTIAFVPSKGTSNLSVTNKSFTFITESEEPVISLSQQEIKVQAVKLDRLKNKKEVETKSEKKASRFCY